jgi:L,D-peptidoglycan transpeptidase YkuD (ErfK/YbiS/YcfS/YnhG family)
METAFEANMAIRRRGNKPSEGTKVAYGRGLWVAGRSRSATRGWLCTGGLVLPCALGRGGRSFRKREGDGAAPSGVWQAVAVLYRADRVRRPKSPLPVRPLKPDDGWCDAVGDRNYNRAVRHPYPASAEHLWRQDSLYDVIVVLDHNRRPRVQGAGSAIFMHVARPGYRPTEGCVALSRRDLLLVLAAVRGTRVVIA